MYGKYGFNDTKSRMNLSRLFSGMTVEEKLDILSHSFDELWYKMRMTRVHTPTYFTAAAKFDNLRSAEHGTRLRRLINESNSARLVWEIPKGKRKGRGETELMCAIREFEEETNIPKRAYQLLPLAPRSFSHVDAGVNYTNTYFISVAHFHFNASVDFSSASQLAEVSDIRWMDIDAVRFADETKCLAEFVRPIFKTARKFVKGR